MHFPNRPRSKLHRRSMRRWLSSSIALRHAATRSWLPKLKVRGWKRISSTFNRSQLLDRNFEAINSALWFAATTGALASLSHRDRTASEQDCAREAVRRSFDPADGGSCISPNRLPAIEGRIPLRAVRKARTELSSACEDLAQIVAGQFIEM
jgi:hypothetical protein